MPWTQPKNKGINKIKTDIPKKKKSSAYDLGIEDFLPQEVDTKRDLRLNWCQ